MKRVGEGNSIYNYQGELPKNYDGEIARLWEELNSLKNKFDSRQLNYLLFFFLKKR